VAMVSPTMEAKDTGLERIVYAWLLIRAEQEGTCQT
jgi:hypothetical protein